jgi:arylsulfatase A-like enzyme/Flp pilus assembly protein TadD
MMRHVPIAAVAATVLLSGCAGGIPPSERSVVLVTLDTTRADRIGVYGGTAVPTPNLDRIAREGTLFETALAQVPLTLPSHAAIFTGRYPSALGVRHNGIYRLPDSATTLAERLREAGFTTAGFISAFVMQRGFGVEQGFDHFNDVPVDRFQGARDRLFEAQRTADDVNEQVFRWLDAHAGEGRFFLWVQYYDPHVPYDPPEVEGRELSGSGYDREISYLDACFGDLVERLEREEMLDSVVLVVAGDHGEGLGDHGEKTHGVFLYEESLRVPFFIRAPGLVPAGEVVEGPVELVDLAPTVLDLLQLPPLDQAQGRTLVPRIDGRDDGSGARAFAETYMPRLDYGWSELASIRDGRWKLVKAPTPELYDLRDDPGEKLNLYYEQPERGERMAAELDEWLATVADPSAESEASRTLTADEEARLRSLGYLSGEHSRTLGDAEEFERADPKEMIAELERFMESRRMLDRGRPDLALERADEILADNPWNHQARVTRILALIRLERYGEAEETARAHVTATATDPAASEILREGAMELVASVYRFQGRLREAEEHYRIVLELNPANESSAVDLARLMIETGRLQDAAVVVEELLRRRPDSGLGLATRFMLEERAGDTAAMAATAARMADVRGGDPDILLRAARLLLDGDPARAAVCLELALETVEPTPELLFHLGNSLVRSGRLEDARSSFLAASRMRPRDPELQFRLGAVALEMGDEKEGRFRMEQAARLEPRYTRGLTVLARWLAGQGRNAEALETARKAAERNPADEEARQLAAELSR